MSTAFGAEYVSGRPRAIYPELEGELEGIDK